MEPVDFCSRCGVGNVVDWEIHNQHHDRQEELEEVVRAWVKTLAGPEPPEMTQQMSMEDIAAALGATEWPTGPFFEGDKDKA